MANEKELLKIFNDNKSKSKDDIIVLFIKSGTSAAEAMRRFSKFARDAGLTINPVERRLKIDAILRDTDLSKASSYEACLQALRKTFVSTSMPTLRRYIKQYASQHDQTLPIEVTASKFDITVSMISKSDMTSKCREDIMKSLQSDDIGYSEAASVRAYHQLRKHYKIGAEKTGSALLVDWFVSHPGASKDDIVSKGEEHGMAKSTVAHYIKTFEMALAIASVLISQMSQDDVAESSGDTADEDDKIIDMLAS